MWKWLSGCAVVIVVVLACAGWWGLQRMKAFTASGGAATVTIAASPERVFASLANADSFATWQTNRLQGSHRGLLVAGDTLRIASDSTTTSADKGATRGANGRPTTVIVTEVKPGVALTMEMRDDNGRHIGSQRDSLVVVGDSTRIVATTEMSMMDSLVTSSRANGKVAAPSMMDAASKMLVSTFRAMHEQELGRLKVRIEGKRPSPHD